MKERSQKQGCLGVQSGHGPELCEEKGERGARSSSQRPKVQKGQVAKRLDHIGKSLWGKGSPVPGLES